jgi:hypothetical protein
LGGYSSVQEGGIKIMLTFEVIKNLIKDHFLAVLITCILVIPATAKVTDKFFQYRIEEYTAQISILKAQLNVSEMEKDSLKIQLEKRNQEIRKSDEQTPSLAPNNSLEQSLLQGDVPFEWQWAGENWYGRMSLGERDGKYTVIQARVGDVEKLVASNTPDVTRMNGRILELIDGNFEIMADNTIKLNMLVDKKNRRTNKVEPVTVSGILQPVACYAGTATYTNDTGSFEGDIILVGYVSSVGNVVNDWFREPNPSWISYGNGNPFQRIYQFFRPDQKTP